MKEKLLNNLGLKILSIFVAFFVWLVVMNVSNPLTSGSKEVPLETVNGQVLTAANRAYENQWKKYGNGQLPGAYQGRLPD